MPRPDLNPPEGWTEHPVVARAISKAQRKIDDAKLDALVAESTEAAVEYLLGLVAEELVQEPGGLAAMEEFRDG